MDLRRWAGSRVLYVLWLCNHYVMGLMLCVDTLSMGTAGEFSTTLVNHSCFYNSNGLSAITYFHIIYQLNKYKYNTIQLKIELKDIHVHKDNKNLAIAYQCKFLHIS